MIHASRQVRGSRHEVGGEHRTGVARLDPDDLVMRRVSAGPLHPHARHDGLVVVDQVDDAGVRERHEVVGEVAGPVPVVRVGRIVPLPAPDDVPRARKPRADLLTVAHREAARVVEVQVRREDDVDVVGRQPGLGERVIEVVRPIDAVDLAEAAAFLVAEAGVDEHRPHAAHDQRPHRQRDPVAVVRRSLALPQRRGTTPNIAPPSSRSKPS